MRIAGSAHEQHRARARRPGAKRGAENPSRGNDSTQKLVFEPFSHEIGHRHWAPAQEPKQNCLSALLPPAQEPKHIFLPELLHTAPGAEQFENISDGRAAVELGKKDMFRLLRWGPM